MTTKENLVNIFIKHSTVFINALAENEKIKNNLYFENIIFKGIEALKYIFIITLSNNYDIKEVDNVLEKAIIYYVEFVSQIGEDTNVFLKLNIKDAIIFVYKKTIFNLVKTNNDINFKEMHTVYDAVDLYIDIIKIQNNGSIENNSIKIISKSFDSTNTLFKNIDINNINKNKEIFDRVRYNLEPKKIIKLLKEVNMKNLFHIVEIVHKINNKTFKTTKDIFTLLK